jgi:hypothetical protein
MKLGVWLLAVLGMTTVTLAQWIPSELQPRNLSVETTGGVAYLKFTYESTCPQELRRMAPSRIGTNVYQQVFLWSNPAVFCPAIFPPLIVVNHVTVVIGAFDPGDYLYHLTTSINDPQSHTLLIPFTVAQDRTITLLPFHGPGIAMQVAGTSNVTYRVLSSTTFTNWTVLNTVENAPFTITNQAGDRAFYRIEIRDRVPAWP